MNVFVIGATGFVGGTLARHLTAREHLVTGLARTDVAAVALAADGITPVVADLDSRRSATIDAALEADVVVYAAQADPMLETATVESLTRAMAGTGKTLIFLSGSGVLLQRTAGAWSQDSFAEHDPFAVEPLATSRKAAEDTVLAAASDRLRAMVIRPGLIWGPGDHGHVPMTYQSVAATGAACYVGPGLHTYSHVHIDDVTRLFTLALEAGRAGGLYHAVAGEVPNRWIARESRTTSAAAPAASHHRKRSWSGESSGPSSWQPPAGCVPCAHSRNWGGAPSAPTCCPRSVKHAWEARRPQHVTDVSLSL
ncbi:NAD-dependent epimerase/dehydratase family protein [Streptomyces mirabilis]|uniref:NAD-dependent epimerase/dehydratase family protein n=1 Tax=Streptomyces mirabilis TaxID=68239 RepID=UPI0036C2701D